jgi:hypothetical protein
LRTTAKHFQYRVDFMLSQRVTAIGSHGALWDNRRRCRAL